MRSSAVRLALAFVVISLMWAAPGTALACACCDGTITRVPLAWSAGGKTLLVLLDGSRTCEDTLAIEVFEPGHEKPRGCLDLWGKTPMVETPCDQLRSGHEARAEEGRVEALEAHPGTGSHPFEWLDAKEYPFFAMALPSHRVRLTVAPDPTEGYRSWGRVETESSGTWAPIWTGVVKTLDWSSGYGVRSWFFDVTATVWPSPDRKQAAVVVANVHPDRDFEDVVHWATLDGPLPPRGNIAALVVHGTANDPKEPWLNLRSAAGPSAAVLAKLPDGTWLAPVEAAGGANATSKWLEVIVVGGASHGAHGWVHTKWVTAIPEPPPSP